MHHNLKHWQTTTNAFLIYLTVEVPSVRHANTLNIDSLSTDWIGVYNRVCPRKISVNEIFKKAMSLFFFE